MKPRGPSSILLFVVFFFVFCCDPPTFFRLTTWSEGFPCADPVHIVSRPVLKSIDNYQIHETTCGYSCRGSTLLVLRMFGAPRTVVRASFVLRVAQSVKDHHTLLHVSPLLKKTCARQV